MISTFEIRQVDSESVIIHSSAVADDLGLRIANPQLCPKGNEPPLGTPTPGTPSTESDPFLALENPLFSRGIYALKAGTYEVSIITYRGTNLPGSGAIGVTTVPEPASMLLLGSGLIGIAALVRRRRGWDVG